MDGLEGQLLTVARSGCVTAVRACLAAGADANVQDGFGGAPLHYAAFLGHTECLAALIAWGADIHMCTDDGHSPLHRAANRSSAAVQLLLAAGADPLAATSPQWQTPLHCAALNTSGHVAVIPLLLQVDPAAALARDINEDTPLTAAIDCGNRDTARCLLEQGPSPHVGEVLSVLAGSGASMRPLYTTLVSHYPVPAEDWELVPTPCPGLGAALPAALGRSAEEAGLLVGHLPLAEQERLRAAALCLARAQRLASAALPTPIVWRILAISAA